MPALTPISGKTYFTISELSSITHVPAYTLRYWENTIKLPRPARRVSGHRRYTQKDIELVFAIKHLLARKAMTLAGAKKAVMSKNPESRTTAYEPASAADAKLAATLKEIRRELSELAKE